MVGKTVIQESIVAGQLLQAIVLPMKKKRASQMKFCWRFFALKRTQIGPISLRIRRRSGSKGGIRGGKTLRTLLTFSSHHLGSSEA